MSENHTRNAEEKLQMAYRHPGLPEHVHAPLHIRKRNLLRRADDHDAIEPDELCERELHVACPRWQVNDEHVKPRRPVDVEEELLGRLLHH